MSCKDEPFTWFSALLLWIFLFWVPISDFQTLKFSTGFFCHLACFLAAGLESDMAHRRSRLHPMLSEHSPVVDSLCLPVALLPSVRPVPSPSWQGLHPSVQPQQSQNGTWLLEITAQQPFWKVQSLFSCVLAQYCFEHQSWPVRTLQVSLICSACVWFPSLSCFLCPFIRLSEVYPSIATNRQILLKTSWRRLF